MITKLSFQNRTTLQAFLVLIFGFIVILIASLFIFSIYLSLNRFQMEKNRFAREYVKSVTMARMMQPKNLNRHLALLKMPHLRFQVAKKPAKNSTRLLDLQPQKLAQYARKNYKKLHVAIRLRNGEWLIVRGGVLPHTWYYSGIMLSSLLLLIALLFLAYFVLRSVAMPTRKFIHAAKSFGVDLQSPPMAIEGPAEIQEVIKSFNEMQARIRRLINDRTQMLAAISHDLRTPITRLQLRAEYLKDSDQYEKAIADLNEMERMISSILSFARDYATTEVSKRFDMNALLETLCDDYIDTGNDVSFESPEKRITFFGRLSALKRAFSNLIENAVKYGDKADVQVCEQHNQLQIKINDFGPGIPETEMEKVFSPFYRVDPSRNPEKLGTGLGLAVARDIVRTHGGDIALFNRDPRGLAVIVTLPLSR